MVWIQIRTDVLGPKLHRSALSISMLVSITKGQTLAKLCARQYVQTVCKRLSAEKVTASKERANHLLNSSQLTCAIHVPLLPEIWILKAKNNLDPD